MIDDHDRFEWVNVSSGTGSESRKMVVCVCVCVCVLKADGLLKVLLLVTCYYQLSGCISDFLSICLFVELWCRMLLSPIS